MGGAACEISDATTDVLLEMAWFQPVGDRPHLAAGSACAPRRRPASRRAATPRSSTWPRPASASWPPTSAAPRSRPATVDGRASCPTAAAGAGAHGPGQPLLGTDLAPAAHPRRCSSPIGFACTSAASASDHDVIVPPWRYDSATEIDVVEEVARHAATSDIPRRDAHRGPRRPAHPRPAATAARCAACCAASAWPRCMPLPFLAPATSSAAGLDPVGIDADEPAGRRGVGAAHSLLPGLVRRPSPTTPPAGQTGVRLFEIGHVFLPPPDGQLLPDEREHLAVVLAGPEAPAAVEVWQVLADLLAGSSARRSRNAERPACTRPAARLVVVDGERSASVGEVDPAVLGPPRHRRAGRLGSRSTSARCSPVPAAPTPTGRSAGSRRATSTWPSRCPTTVSASDVERTLAGGRPAGVVGAPVRRLPRRSSRRAGRRSLAFAVRLQATDRTLTDAEVADARRPSSTRSSRSTAPPSRAERGRRPVRSAIPIA